MKITCKTTLLASSGETRVLIKLDDPASLTWGMSSLVLAEGRQAAVIDWGDRSRSEIRENGEITHAYAEPGIYEVRLSDDLKGFGCAVLSIDSPFSSVYAPMILEFRTTAVLLQELKASSFHNAERLSTFECAGSGLRTLRSMSFQSCPSLVGEVNLPGVDSVSYSTFTHSTGVTKIHFSAANEETIKASTGWKKSNGNFGAINATSVFDL